MAGIKVDRTIMDIRLGEAAKALRESFDRVESIATYLANNPGSGASDPLVTEHSYTQDEAYLIRLIFEGFNGIRSNNTDLFHQTHKLTGLE